MMLSNGLTGLFPSPRSMLEIRGADSALPSSVVIFTLLSENVRPAEDDTSCKIFGTVDVYKMQLQVKSDQNCLCHCLI